MVTTVDTGMIELIKHQLSVDGFSVLNPSNHRFNELRQITKRFDNSSWQEFNNPYRPKIFSERSLGKSENSDLQSYNTFCKNIIRLLGYKQNSFDAIFQTLDTPDSRHIAQAPHFDRIHTLKFMLYVNTLSHGSGAFCLSKGSHIWTRENFGIPSKRPSHGAAGFLAATRDIPNSILERLSPVEGEAGTIVIFDTDCIHHQGIVTAGQSMIVRAHYRTVRTNPFASLLRQF